MPRTLPFALLVACAGDPGPPGHSDAPIEAPLHVARDCPAAPGVICPWAGDGYNGFLGDGGDRLDAWFSFPVSVAFSPLGDPLLADLNNGRLRAIATDGTVRTAAELHHPSMAAYRSDGTVLVTTGTQLIAWDPATGATNVIAGAAAGTLDQALLAHPAALVLTPTEDVYLVDTGNDQIRFVDFAAGTVTTVAGGTQGYCGDGGPAVDACLALPAGLALDADRGLLYVADGGNHVIRAIDLATGTIDRVAGTPGTAGFDDGADGTFDSPGGLVLDGDALFVADTGNHAIRVIDLASGLTSTFAGTGRAACSDPGASPDVPQVCADQHAAGDGGPATQAALYRPSGVAIAPDGSVVIADTWAFRFRVVTR